MPKVMVGTPKRGLFFAGNAGRTIAKTNPIRSLNNVADKGPTASIEAVESGLAAQGYIASRQIATAVYLSQQIEKPILVEGPAGVGKTELAKAIAHWRGQKMIRLQCYEGLDEAKALYEWKYAKQLLYTQILKDKLGEVLGGAQTLHAALEQLHDFGDVFFSKEFVEPRPLLQALEQPARLRAADRRDRQVGRRIRIAAAGNPLATSRSPFPSSARSRRSRRRP